MAALSWPARRDKAWGADELEQTAVPEAVPAQFSHSPYAREDGFAFGVTVDQIDQLNGLMSSIRAHGDVISAGGLGALTAGTLPALGNAIFEGANEARVLLSQLESQPLNDPSDSTLSVGEASAEYRVSAVFSISGTVPHLRHQSLILIRKVSRLNPNRRQHWMPSSNTQVVRAKV
jgi:hypothetical protein